MLAWHKRDDGWWEAPAPPIRVDKKIARMRCPSGTEPTNADYWVEVGGKYVISKSEMTKDELEEWRRYRECRDEFRKRHHPTYKACDEDERHCFRVGYQLKDGESTDPAGVAYTLGDARVQVEGHYFDRCKAAMAAIKGPIVALAATEAMPALRRIKWATQNGRRIEIWAEPEPLRSVVWEIVHLKGSDPGKAFVTCEFADERDPDFERLGEFATREEAEAFLAADVHLRPQSTILGTTAYIPQVSSASRLPSI